MKPFHVTSSMIISNHVIINENIRLLRCISKNWELFLLIFFFQSVHGFNQQSLQINTIRLRKWFFVKHFVFVSLFSTTINSSISISQTICTNFSIKIISNTFTVFQSPFKPIQPMQPLNRHHYLHRICFTINTRCMFIKC